MTKSEARAIAEMTARALHALNTKLEIAWPDSIQPPTRTDVRAQVHRALESVVDEIERIRVMALAEIDK